MVEKIRLQNILASEESHIEKIMLPEMPVNEVIWILVSDSCTDHRA